MNRIRIFFSNLTGRIRYLFARWRRKLLDIVVLQAGHWRWASLGILLIIGLILLGMLKEFIGVMHPLVYLGALVMMLGIPLLIGLGIRLGLKFLRVIPERYGWLFFAAVVFVFTIFGFPQQALIIIAAFLILSGAFIGGGLYNLTGGRWAALRRIHRILTVVFLVTGTGLFSFGTWYLIYPGSEPERVEAAAMKAEVLPLQMEADDPSLRGPYPVDSLYYGWGNDKRRPEFGEKVSIVTPLVDGSNFLDGWDKLAGRLRTLYWKVTPDSLPLNGRVWVPDGEGPFPLVLMVHGNHLDRDFSDPGYAYLGRHFASHGIIAVSVDENFLNGSWSDFDHSLETENDCRGWLLLKHLEQWRSWNRSDSSRFRGRVDMDRIVLIGHSRGGEAVSIASCFNRLPYYPDKAEEAFHFGFGIRGIAAIAPVDGQYYPAGIPTPLRDVNYFTIQGSMDGDMRSYHGLRQMRRIEFSGSAYHFVAGLYTHGANHGQFNRRWGMLDIGYPNSLLLNRRAIIPVELQEQVALVYLTAFVKESLYPGSGYVDLFRDYRRGREWLPDLVYLNQFHESEARVVCGFEEDIDLTTGTLGTDSLAANGLALWQEGRIPMKWGDQRNNGVFLGWNNETDSLPGEYRIHLDPSMPGSLSGYRYLSFLAADAQIDPGDRPGKESAGEENFPADSSEGPSGDFPADSAEGPSGDFPADSVEEFVPIDFTIELTDTGGNRYRLRMGEYIMLQPPIKPQVFKSNLFWDDPESEVILQYVRLPLEAFRADSTEAFSAGSRELVSGSGLPVVEGTTPDGKMPPAAEQIRTIKFVFDGQGKGSVVLDQIGFSR